MTTDQTATPHRIVHMDRMDRLKRHEPGTARKWSHDASPVQLPDGSYRAACVCGWVGGRSLGRASCVTSARWHNNGVLK